MEFDSWLTMGLDGPAGDNELAPSTIGDLNNGWVSNFEAGMNILIEDSIGGAMFVTNDAGTTNIVSGADQRILIGQFTTDGVMSGVVNVQMFTEGIVDPADRLALPFDGVGLHTEVGDVVCGCMDEMACNYDATVTHDDGSCEYESCLECTDDTACNYNEDATLDDGSCTYPEFGCFDCEGNCLSDQDGDGCATALNSPAAPILRHATTIQSTRTTRAIAITPKNSTTVKATVCSTPTEMVHAMSSKFWGARMRNSAITTLKRLKTMEAVERTTRPMISAKAR